MRREYGIESITINSKTITKLIVDDHVDKHSDHINDELIMKLIRSLKDQRFEPIKESEGFQYFASVIKEEDKWYKLVWLLERESIFIGVITAFRDRRIK